MVRAQPYLIVAAAGTLAWQLCAPTQFLLLGSLHFLAFFVTAMVCHGQLAANRPGESHLTEFYLWMSLGGVLGGLMNALVAPLVFSGTVEYPLMMLAACLLRPPGAADRKARAWASPIVLPAAILLVCGGLTWFLQSWVPLMAWDNASGVALRLAVLGSAAVAAFLLRQRAVQFGVGVAALLAVSLWYPATRTHVLHTERSFFGVLRVTEDSLWNTHELLHGATCHGRQSLNEDERREPWTYYHPTGPLGRIFAALQPRRPLADIGVLGLGTGTIAAYGQPGERITFYEIDPAVERIARNPQYFTYLADCRAKVEVILGDARLSLVHGPPRQFDLLILDVFSSDSVPTHLVTYEALQVYFHRLTDHGLLAIHISSRYLNLQPILGRLAKNAAVAARLCEDRTGSSNPRKYNSDWVVMARRDEDLASFAAASGWKPLPADTGRVWTDDFSNVVGALRPDFSWRWLWPSNLWRSEKDQASRHIYLGAILMKQKRFEEAAAHFQTAVELNPDDAEAHNSLGAALALCGQVDAAIMRFQRALEINPELAETHYNFANLLVGRGRAGEAIEHYQIAVDMDSQNVAARRNLAWLLATHPEASLRNGGKAIELASQAVHLTEDNDPAMLDTLSAAYAEAGQFAAAIETARKALELAAQQDKPAAVKSIRARILLYQAGTPFRETPIAGTQRH